MLNIRIALRFILKKPLQYLFMLFVVTLGVAIFYFVYNASDGLKRAVLSTTAEANSHITIKGDFNFSSYSNEDISNFRNDAFTSDSRIKVISYTLTVPGELNRLWLPTNSNILIKGLDFEEGGDIQFIKSRVTNGKGNNAPKTLYDDINFFGEIAIGSRLMNSLGFQEKEQALGKPLKVNVFLSDNAFETFIFKIVAVYSTDQVELSEGMAFTTIETLHKIDHFKNKANQIEINTSNVLSSDDVEYKLTKIIDDHYSDYTITNWQNGNKYIVNALYIEQVSILLIQVFTALAISFGLASIITFSIREKNKQIGILKSLGLNNLQVIKIFLFQIFVLLILGIYLGLNLGNYISLLFMKIFRRPHSGTALVNLTVGIINQHSLFTTITMLFSSLIASLIPLKMVEKLKIIEVIKGGE